jgi:hypothetical protein
MNLRADENGVTLEILVQPRASRARLGPVREGRLVVAVTAPPVEGEANRAVVDLLARALGIAKSRIEVVRGFGSRRKTLHVSGSPKELGDRLESAISRL